MSRVAATFASLRNRNFRLYFGGLTISASGTWMQKVGQAWLVLELGGSGTLLGVVAAMQQLPVLLLSPWGGLVADRVDKRRLLVATQTAAAMVAVALYALTVTDVVEIWMVLLLAPVLGTIDAIDRPSRTTIPVELVGREHVLNAVSLNTVVMNASKAIGPAIGGVLIATAGVATCFLANAVSYGAVVVGLLLIRPDEMHRSEPAPRRPGQLRDGFRYVRATPGLAGPLFLMTITGLVAYEWQTTLPLLADEGFGGGPETFGLLFSAMGIGAVCGGLAVAANRTVDNARLLVVASLFGVLLLLVALAPTLALALAGLALVGAASSIIRSQASALLQIQSRAEMRGRVMALLAVATAGTTPIGGPVVGWIGETFGSRAAVAFGGVGSLVAVALTTSYLRKQGEPIRGALLRTTPLTVEDAAVTTN